jgi:hypothetical protein
MNGTTHNTHVGLHSTICQALVKSNTRLLKLAKGHLIIVVRHHLLHLLKQVLHQDVDDVHPSILRPPSLVLEHVDTVILLTHVQYKNETLVAVKQLLMHHQIYVRLHGETNRK